MGKFCEAYIAINVETEKDALALTKLLNTVHDRIQSKYDHPVTDFGIKDWDHYDTEIEQVFRISSQKIDDLNWRIEALITELKEAVQKGEISKIEKFQANTMIEGDSWNLESDEFTQTLKVID